MKFKIYLFLIQYSLFCNQYDTVIAKAFVGRNVRRARQEEFSFVVSLKAIDNQNDSPEDDHRCTGSLISVKDILTVSHALERIHLHRFEVMFGSVDLRCNSKRYPAWWINYKHWASRNNVPFEFEEDDVAMIRLTEGVTDQVIPAVLLPLPSHTLYGQDIRVAGWGTTINGDYQRYLQTALLTIMTISECNTRVNAFFNEPADFPHNVLCSTADPIVLSTAGDSGGPVLFMDAIVAVHIGLVPNVLRGLHPSIQYDFASAKAFVGQNVRQANEGEFHYVVSFKERNHPIPENGHRCTGAMITVKDALTTSHGLEEVQLQSFEIIVGSVDLRCNTKRYPAWWINYKQWAQRNQITIVFDEDDIAIIRLTQAVPENINPVILFPLPRDALFGQNITFAGWGRTITNEVPRYMQTGVLTVMTTTDCENRINSFLTNVGYLPSNVLCSFADPWILSTPGDSGSPVLYMELLVAVNVGIVPVVLSGLHPSKVNVHISISEFMNFISNIIATR